MTEPTDQTEDARAAARGGASLLVLQSIGRLSGLLFVVVVTRHLPPAQFGRYSTVAAVVLLGNFIGDFGTSAAITRLVSRAPHRASEVLSTTLLGSLSLGLLAYAGAVLFAVLSYGGTAIVDVAIGAAAIPTAAMLSSVLGALDGNGLIAGRAAISALQTLTVAAGAFPVLLGTGVRGALVAMALAPAICLVVAVTAARRTGLWTSGLRLDRHRTMELIRLAAPYAATGGLAALTMRFDVVLLSLITSPAETARYDLALRLLEAGTYLSAALTAPCLFLLSRRLGTGDREGAARIFAEAVKLLYLLGLPLSVGLALLARPVVSFVLGPEFGSVTLPFAVMGTAQWLTWLISTQSALIMAGDHMWKAMVTGVEIVALTIMLDVALVPLFGATGAAVAMVVSWVFTAYVLHRLSRRSVGIPTALPSVATLASTALMGIVVGALRNLPLAVSVTAGVLAYAATAFATGAFSVREGARLMTFLRRKRGSQMEAVSRSSSAPLRSPPAENA